MKTFGMLKWAAGLLMVLMAAMPVSASAQDEQTGESREALAQMLAPIALYPDLLLSQVLMASTYPLEIVAADRWVKKNPLLTGDNLDEALRDKDWDASVKALCHEPTLLALMSEKLDETTRIGNAFLAQEGEVMDVIQELRTHAYQDGNLRSNNKQKVTLEADGAIVIEPVDTQIVYVPYYNTRYVYGDWWYPEWPPWYWGPHEMVFGSGVYFWPDVYIGFGFRSYFDWPGRTIIIDVRHRPRYFHRDYNWKACSGRWHHNPHHRRGIAYHSRSTAKRISKNSVHYGFQNLQKTATLNRREAYGSQTGVKQSYPVNKWNNLSGIGKGSQSTIRSGETENAKRFEHQASVHRKTETFTKKSQTRTWSIPNQPVNGTSNQNGRTEKRSTYHQTRRNNSISAGMGTGGRESQTNRSSNRNLGTAYLQKNQKSYSSSYFHKWGRGDDSLRTREK